MTGADDTAVKPFGIGPVLASGIRAGFTRFWLYVPLALIIYVPTVAVFLLIPPSDPPALFYEISSVDSIVLMFCRCFMTLAATIGVVASVGGRRLTVAQVLFALIPRLGVMAVTAALLTGIFFVFVAVPLVDPTTYLTWIAFIPYTITTVVLWVALPAVAMERVGPFGSLRRSWSLTKGHRWSVFGIVLIIDVVNISVVLFFELFLLAAFGFQSPALFLVVYFFVEATLFMIYSIAAAYSYVYLKVSKEGPDIDDLARVFA